MTRLKPAVTPTEIQSRDAARDAKLAALHTTLTEQITAIRNGQDWQDWLKVAARFHNYSFNNVTLIAAQCSAAGRPPATAVAGFGAWKALGRQVNKGERGIQILAPMVRRPGTSDTTVGGTSDSTGTRRDGTSGPAGTDVEPAAEPAGVAGWRVVHVFDIIQTSGAPLPERPMPELLAGQAPDGLWQALAEQVAAHGFALQRGACGTANGLTDYTRRTVTVRTDIDDAAAVKTLSHELAHVLLHDPTGAATLTIPGAAALTAAPVLTVAVTTSFGQCRGRVEVEAESVAYLITASHGLDSSTYSFPYVAGWAGSVDSVKPETVVRATGERVLAAARVILAATEHIGGAATTASQTQARAQNLHAAGDLGASVGRGPQQTAVLLATVLHPDQAAEQLPTSPSALSPSSGLSPSPSPSPERLTQLHELAVAFYSARLHAGGPDAQRAAALLAERGVHPGAVLDARLGYAPRAWTTLVEHLRAAGIDDSELLASGLVLSSSRGSLVDRFRDRLIFPVQTEPGRTVALLGRMVDPTAADSAGAPVPKYLNNPETTIYCKGEVLYGLGNAAAALTAGATPVLVEGPMDVLAVTYAGQPESTTAATTSTPVFVGVAACGTALTASQVALLDQAVGGLADRGVVTAFDGDPAGRAASVRAFELLRAVGAWPHAVDMPAGQDPALLLQQHGPAGLRAALCAASRRPLADVVIDERIDRYANQLRWPEGRVSAGRAAATVIATLPAERVGRQVARLVARLDLPMATVTELVVEAVTSPIRPAAHAGTRRPAEHKPYPGSPRRATAPPTAALRASAGFPVSLQSSLQPPPGPAACDVSQPRASLAAPVPEHRPRSA
jgi:DNA primase